MIYPEKLTLDGSEFRTTRINEAMQVIYSLDAGLSGNKNRTNQNNSNLSYLSGWQDGNLARNPISFNLLFFHRYSCYRFGNSMKTYQKLSNKYN